jgi:signal recognition particle subunit SRP19
MPSKKEHLIVIYPEYFDRALSRAEGRRVPTNVAIKDPDLKIIARAARKAGIKARTDEGAAYSPRWWEPRGRLLIKKGDVSKTEIIARIAKKLPKGTKDSPDRKGKK